MILALILSAMVQPVPAAVEPARVTPVLEQAKLAGTVLIARGDTILYERAFGTVAPEGGVRHRLGQRWRYASVTKQWTATLAMQDVAAGRLDLDRPIRAYLPESKAPFADRITPRMLMQHISGVPRTEESPIGADEWPSYYLLPPGDKGTGRAYCEGPTDRAPPAAFHYGDCDFILMGAVIEAINKKSFAMLVRDRIARPLGLKSIGLAAGKVTTTVGYQKGKRESTRFRLGNFGAAGALEGTTHDLFKFDRALMAGKLLPDAQREIMWTGDSKRGFAALGQWAFSSPIKGCGGSPVRIVERRGAIGGVVLRNIILPDLDMVLIMTSNRAEADAEFGEIWQQRGITHDVLAAALCPAAAK